jgi:hypothetical protein
MTNDLDVLLIETIPYSGLHSAVELGAAGHRVHRCYPERPVASSGRDAPALRMCVAVTGGTCPIDTSGIDVAVVAGPVGTGPDVLGPAGVTCALRHRIPVVADDTCETSFGGGRARRAQGGVVAACERAADHAFDDLRADIFRRLGPTLAAAAVDVEQLDCSFALEGTRLTVTVSGPSGDRALEQAIGVRVFDAVREAGRPYRQVNVAYDTRD